jgi:UDP:flavonoid glycosyltransferase YjiC (YdhE family)
MRLLITTHGGAGHFNPLAPIADAALAAGHQVRFAVEPPFDEHIRRCGYDAAPIGMEFDFQQPPPDLVAPPHLSELESMQWTMANIFFGALAHAAMPDAARVIDEWAPDVVFGEITEVAGLLAAEKAGIPHGTFNFGGLDMSLMRIIAGDAWDALRSEYDLPPDGTFTALTGSVIVAAMPECWAGFSAPGLLRVQLPLFDRGAANAVSIHQVLDDGPAADERPLVYGSLGTVNRDEAALDALIAGLALHGGPAVVTTGRLDPPASPSNDVRVIRYVPNSAILGRAAAVVTHGGFNTLLGALQAGLPQVLMPLTADQPMNAARAEQLGVAVVIGPTERDAATISAAVDRVLGDPSYAARARELQGELELLPPPTAAVAALVALSSGS